MFSGNITRLGNFDASGFDMTGGILEQGVALIAPGDDRRVLEKHGFGVQIRTNQQPPENYCRPGVDVLFRSTAKIYRAGVLAVVLTGMGQDGLHGCEGIREAGGQILVQDEASSVVWGMLGSVANSGKGRSSGILASNGRRNYRSSQAILDFRF